MFEENRRDRRHFSSLLVYVGFSIFIVSILYLIFLKQPSSFSAPTLVLIQEGQTISGITDIFDSKALIRSPFAFKSLLILFGGTHGLVAGDYALNNPENALILAWRLSHGLYGVQSVHITVPEGLNVFETATLFDKQLYRFDAKDFIHIASSSEGYLFPDTYYFLPNATAKEVYTTMRARFDEKIMEVAPDIAKFRRSLSDVVKMASIVEEEGRTEMTRKMIAGILWKRFDQGMPLQVDSAFEYVNGEKDSAKLSLDDLKIESPYNTYIHKGLPPTPIANPGIASIEATIAPISSPYYFYLSDKNGEMHYAVTLSEHVANKDKYLR